MILDEPSSGLDPLLQNQFYEFVIQQSHQGRTAFMSSHVLSEVDRVCDRVGIIREGRIVAVERIETLKQKMGQVYTVEFDRQSDADDFRTEDFQIPGVSKVQLDGRTLSLHVTGNHDRVLKALSGYKITQLLAEEYSLDNLFLEYYQRGNESEK